MIDRHSLGNMIFNLENRKGLKEVKFTQKAVIEVLDYLKELQDLDAEHKLLIIQFEGETEKLRKQIKKESDARKRFVEALKELKEHTHDLNNKLLNLDLFLKDLRDTFHEKDEVYQEIDKKLKELGGGNEDKRNANFNNGKAGS